VKYLGQYKFNVKESKEHIMDIIMEPAYDRPVCFQIHINENEKYAVYWNYGLSMQEIHDLLATSIPLELIRTKFIEKHFIYSNSEKIRDERVSKCLELFGQSTVQFRTLQSDEKRQLHKVLKMGFGTLFNYARIDGMTTAILIHKEDSPVEDSPVIEWLGEELLKEYSILRSFIEMLCINSDTYLYKEYSTQIGRGWIRRKLM